MISLVISRFRAHVHGPGKTFERHLCTGYGFLAHSLPNMVKHEITALTVAFKPGYSRADTHDLDKVQLLLNPTLSTYGRAYDSMYFKPKFQEPELSPFRPPTNSLIMPFPNLSL
jgi:hypothetical protein